MEHKQYNLRSKKKDCSIPIQLQLASEDFMAALRPSTSGQVFESDHTDSSDSDIDVSDLINHSDQNLSYPVNRDKEAFPGGGQGPANQEVSNDSISQNDINRQILQKLSNLGDRLAVIEGNRGHKLYKKTTDAKQIKTSNKVKRSKGAVAQSSPSHQQGEMAVGWQAIESQPPISLDKKHIYERKCMQDYYIWRIGQKQVQTKLSLKEVVLWMCSFQKE